MLRVAAVFAAMLFTSSCKPRARCKAACERVMDLFRAELASAEPSRLPSFDRDERGPAVERCIDDCSRGNVACLERAPSRDDARACVR
jgi:hypothetical protein